MATFTESELAVAVSVRQEVRDLYALVRDARRLGLDVSLKACYAYDEGEVGPGGILELPAPQGERTSGPEVFIPLGPDDTLAVLVFRAVVVEAAGTSSEPHDATLPHGWMD